MKKHFYKTDTYLNKMVLPQGSAIIYERVFQKNLQINEYHMKAGFTLYFQPPKNEEGLKSYCILSGEIQALESKESLSNGDLVVLNYKDEPFHFKVLSETRVLVHSINEDSFNTTKKTFEHIYHILSKIQEKDSYTSDHSYHVHDLVSNMGSALGYSGKRMLNLLLAAQFHDIGKINIPDHILNKPDKLTEKEFIIMKSHVEEGKALILEFFSEDVYKIVALHHERENGSGYPLGLKKDDIMEEAKILAICDSYDAMISQRVYKKAKSKDEAVEELIAFKDILFDGKLVDLFISLL